MSTITPTPPAAGIDIDSESLLSLAEAAKYVAARFRSGRNGRPLALSTVHRWALRGIRGIRLEVINVGGARATSVEALARFFCRLAGNDSQFAAPVSAPAPSDPSSSPAANTSRERRAAAAMKELDRQGV